MGNEFKTDSGLHGDPPAASSALLGRWAVAVVLTKDAAWSAPIVITCCLGIWSAASEAEAVGLAVREALETNKDQRIGMVTQLKIEPP